MNELANEMKTGGNKMTILGAIAIVLGMLCLLAPGITGISVITLVGIFVVGGGVVRMLWAFSAGSLGRGMLMFAIGGLTLLCGVALIGHPLFASGVLTVMLAIYFVADGVTELVGAFQVRPVSGWGWLLFGGIVSILLGIMIWRQFPLSGTWAIGVLLGIKLFVVGLIMVAGGSTLQSVAKAADAP